MAEYKRILIATKFRFIGDTLLAIPIFRAARRRWPSANIVLLTGEHAHVLLQNNPYLDEIIEFNPTGKDSGIAAFSRVVTQLRRSRFDLCVILNRSFHSALIPWLAGIPTRAGWDSEGRGGLVNRRVKYDGDKSEISCYYDVLRAVAPDVPIEPSLELWVSDEESRWASDILSECVEPNSINPSNVEDHTPLIGIQPGASLPIKRWPAEHFATVADTVIQSRPDARIVLIGSPDELTDAEAMLAACAPATTVRVSSMVGKCNLRQSLALVSRLALFVGNDTAVMHSAVALGVRTVALFGPTNPRKWGNFGECNSVIESGDGTMTSIVPSLVADAALSLLGGLGSDSPSSSGD